MRLISKIKNWWDDPIYDQKQPMTFPDKSRGRTKPLRVMGTCNHPEACKCKGLRLHGVCPCNEGETFSCACYHG